MILEMIDGEEITGQIVSKLTCWLGDTNRAVNAFVGTIGLPFLGCLLPLPLAVTVLELTCATWVEGLGIGKSLLIKEIRVPTSHEKKSTYNKSV